MVQRDRSTQRRISKLFGILLIVCVGALSLAACGSRDEMEHFIDSLFLGLAYGDDEDLEPGSAAPGGSQMMPGDTADSAGQGVFQDLASYGGPLKPVGFRNSGSKGATVLPWTYIPLNSEEAVVPPYASTVASPGGNSSGYLSLPLGKYTFCYYWEQGDVNGDGMMDYTHTHAGATVVLDETDPDDAGMAEVVQISAPPGIFEEPGMCDPQNWANLDIRPYIVDSRHYDQFMYGYSMVVLAHLSDYVTLKGPITVEYYFKHCDASPCTTPQITEAKVRVAITEGETQQFYLEEAMGEHPGNWDLFIQIVSVDG